MWRCRCGESNLSVNARCHSCARARAISEIVHAEYRPRRRWKAVQVGFFGLGIEDPRGENAAAEPGRWTEAELDDHYRREELRSRWYWIRYALLVVVIILVLLLQIFRGD